MNRRILREGHAGVLLHLVQDLEGDFTASGSSRHDQVALPRCAMRQRLNCRRKNQLPSTAPMIRQGRLDRKGGRMTQVRFRRDGLVH